MLRSGSCQVHLLLLRLSFIVLLQLLVVTEGVVALVDECAVDTRARPDLLLEVILLNASRSLGEGAVPLILCAVHRNGDFTLDFIQFLRFRIYLHSKFGGRLID